MGKLLARMRAQRVIALFVWILAAASAQAAVAQAAVIDELNPSQRQDLMAGKLVLVTQDIQGFPWPEITLYKLVNATAEEAMAVTFDYELRPKFTPDLSFAKVSKILDARTHEVDYILQLPVIGAERFTLHHEISTYDSGKSFRMDLHLVRADRTKRSDGTSRIETLDNRAVFSIVSFIDPGSPLAHLIRGRAIKQASEAAEGFARQVEKEKATQPEILNAQLERLRAALSR